MHLSMYKEKIGWAGGGGNNLDAWATVHKAAHINEIKKSTRNVILCLF